MAAFIKHLMNENLQIFCGKQQHHSYVVRSRKIAYRHATCNPCSATPLAPASVPVPVSKSVLHLLSHYLPGCMRLVTAERKHVILHPSCKRTNTPILIFERARRLFSGASVHLLILHHFITKWPNAVWCMIAKVIVIGLQGWVKHSPTQHARTHAHTLNYIKLEGYKKLYNNTLLLVFVLLRPDCLWFVLEFVNAWTVSVS